MRNLTLLLCFVLYSCSRGLSPTDPFKPLPAHAVADGTPVPGSPEPEVVQLRKIETVGTAKHVTVGNAAGDYMLVCDLGANGETGIQSCVSPDPLRDYLLFRTETKWLRKGATQPMSLKFMEDFSVSYNDHENVGLMAAKPATEENFGVYWLSSWSSR